MHRSAAALESLRRDLTHAGEEAWSALVDATEGLVRPPAGQPVSSVAPIAEGAAVLLGPVDPTVQQGDRETRAIVHTEGARWAIALTPALLATLRRLHDLQATFGFPREPRWTVLGRVLAPEPALDADPDEPAPTPPWPVAPRAIRVEGQLTLLGPLERAPKVPGLDAAEAALAALHAPLAGLPVGPTPAALLDALFAALRHHHWRLFRTLWTPGTTELDLLFKWEQFHHAWAACEGQLDVGPLAPDERDPRLLRAPITRADGHGHTLTRPLVLRPAQDGWRLDGGIL